MPLSPEAETQIGKWIIFIQENWAHFRSIAAQYYHRDGRGAIVVDVSREPQLFEQIDCVRYLTVERAKDTAGVRGLSLLTFRGRISECNPERQILFYFWDSLEEIATPRVLSEYCNGTLVIDTDAVWHNKARRCPKCSTIFTSVRDRGQCTHCGHIFLASDPAARHSLRNSDMHAPPIVEVVIDTSSASDIESLINLIDEKETVRGEEALSRKEQMILDVVELVAQVRNGGFQQFFGNSSGDRVRPTMDALKHIGAIQTLAIVRRACAVFPHSRPSPDGDKRWDQIEKLCDDEDEDFDPWERVNAEFGDEDLNQLMWVYWNRGDA